MWLCRIRTDGHMFWRRTRRPQSRQGIYIYTYYRDEIDHWVELFRQCCRFRVSAGRLAPPIVISLSTGLWRSPESGPERVHPAPNLHHNRVIDRMWVWSKPLHNDHEFKKRRNASASDRRQSHNSTYVIAFRYSSPLRSPSVVNTFPLCGRMEWQT
jgi:hypothetical protein